MFVTTDETIEDKTKQAGDALNKLSRVTDYNALLKAAAAIT